MGSYMLVVLLTIDSARLDSIMFTIVFSGYNMGRPGQSLGVTTF